MRVSISLSLAVALAGCAAQPALTPDAEAMFRAAQVAAKTPASISAKSAREAILRDRARLFKDAPSIRDAKIGPPFTCRSGSGNCICVEANAKNSYGGYAGTSTMLLRVDVVAETEGISTALDRDARESLCGTMAPFPELNGKK